MYFDRLDICMAYYLFGSEFHGGMFTREYAYMGRARRAGFRPGPSFGLRSLSDNAREIYNALVERFAPEEEAELAEAAE